jgi:hypothetical protein
VRTNVKEVALQVEPLHRCFSNFIPAADRQPTKGQTGVSDHGSSAQLDPAVALAVENSSVLGRQLRQKSVGRAYLVQVISFGPFSSDN